MGSCRVGTLVLLVALVSACGVSRADSRTAERHHQLALDAEAAIVLPDGYTRAQVRDYGTPHPQDQANTGIGELRVYLAPPPGATNQQILNDLNTTLVTQGWTPVLLNPGEKQGKDGRGSAVCDADVASLLFVRDGRDLGVVIDRRDQSQAISMHPTQLIWQISYRWNGTPMRRADLLEFRTWVPVCP